MSCFQCGSPVLTHQLLHELADAQRAVKVAAQIITVARRNGVKLDPAWLVNLVARALAESREDGADGC